MTNQFKMKSVSLDRLILSPDLSADYRHVLLGLTYRASLLSELPEQFLIDYVMAHPPIGVMVGKNFHVTANVRTLALKPFLPEKTRIRVIVNDVADLPDVEFVSAQREMLNLIVNAIEGKHYTYAIAALRDVVVKNDDAKTSFASEIKSLAKVAGLRRQSLSEIKAMRRAIQPGGGANV
jgi:hypothetical protein